MDGQCGTALNQCLVGPFKDVADTADEYKWQCEGQYLGTTAHCSLGKPKDGVCGPAHEDTRTSVPTGTAACEAGTRSSVTTTTANYTWTCASTNGGATSSTCTACRTGYTWNGSSCVKIDYQCIGNVPLNATLVS